MKELCLHWLFIHNNECNYFLAAIITEMTEILPAVMYFQEKRKRERPENHSKAQPGVTFRVITKKTLLLVFNVTVPFVFFLLCVVGVRDFLLHTPNEKLATTLSRLEPLIHLNDLLSLTTNCHSWTLQHYFVFVQNVSCLKVLHIGMKTLACWSKQFISSRYQISRQYSSLFCVCEQKDQNASSHISTHLECLRETHLSQQHINYGRFSS